MPFFGMPPRRVSGLISTTAAQLFQSGLPDQADATFEGSRGRRSGSLYHVGFRV